MRTWLFTLTGSMAFWIVLKATLLLAATALVAAACRKASAAARHVIWSTGVASVLLLPLASLAAPAWTVEIRVPDRADAARSAPKRRRRHAKSRWRLRRPVGSRRPLCLTCRRGRTTTPGLTAGSMAWAAYAAGLLLVLLHLAVQHARVRRLSRAATPVTDPEWAAAARRRRAPGRRHRWCPPAAQP